MSMKILINWTPKESAQLHAWIENEIAQGEFDDAVFKRFSNSDKLIDDFCEGCDHKCKDTCDGWRYRT